MRRSLPFFLLAILFLLTCQVSEEEKIYQVLNRRQEALQKRDLSLYLSCISKAYQDKEEDFNRLQKRIEGYFKTFDRISYSCWDQSIQVDGETAVVIQPFYLQVEKGENKNHYSGKEVLFLKREGRDWKIIKGL
ncbi:MAG TPA: nuclear transport factor 2 family protein [Thermodesulfobacteriota bacterium]|nr:nuclear transport factor 2 family protein [Thermodesulfobacteriota bacterium]